MDSYTGEIRVARSLVAVGPQDRVLFIVATDLGRPARSATGVVVIGLQGESERGPRFPRASSDIALRENAPAGKSQTMSSNHGSLHCLGLLIQNDPQTLSV